MDGREIIERWLQYFEEDLNVGTGENGDERNDYASAAQDGNVLTPTLREVKDVIHQLKPNNAA